MPLTQNSLHIDPWNEFKKTREREIERERERAGFGQLFPMSHRSPGQAPSTARNLWGAAMPFFTAGVDATSALAKEKQQQSRAATPRVPDGQDGLVGCQKILQQRKVLVGCSEAKKLIAAEAELEVRIIQNRGMAGLSIAKYQCLNMPRRRFERSYLRLKRPICCNFNRTATDKIIQGLLKFVSSDFPLRQQL